MKRKQLLAWAVVAAIGGLAMTSIASAYAPVKVESNGDLTVCGIEYVSDGNGSEWCITIQWKNVWAIATWAWPSADSSSYWDFYWRWVNTPYLSWQEESINYDNNAWWWWNDNQNPVNSYPVDNELDRIWPCDGWYHVPSQWEWHALFDMWAEIETHWGIYSNISEFYTDFQIPFAGYHGAVAWTFAFLWSSTPASSAYGTNFYMDTSMVVGRDAHFKSNYYPVRCFKNSPVYIEPTDSTIQTTIWQTVYNELPSTMTVTINNVQQAEGKPVLWEVSVSFWENTSAKFSKPVKINIPVAWNEDVLIKVKHAWSSEYNYDWLTTNANVSCSNWTPTSSQYNWSPIKVVDWYASIYTCEASSFVALDVPPTVAQINLSVIKWALTIWTETWNLNLWQVNVSNSAQELSWSFGANSFWVEDMKWLETGYYTTISVTDLNWTVSGHSISANNVSLKTAWSMPSDISWATASEAKVIFWNGITDWHSWSWQVNYFQRLNTATADAWRVWKWWDNLQIKVNIPAHTPYDTYRWTITYTLYDNDL